MSITIQLTAHQEERLRQEAARQGVEPAEYATRLVEQGLRPSRSLAEILAPFRRQVEASGLSDRDLDELFADARERVFRAERELPAQ